MILRQFSRTGRCDHTEQELALPPSLLSLSRCLSVCLSSTLSAWLCGIELLITIVARPNEFRPSSFCNGAADPKLRALILLSSVWRKNHLTAIQLWRSLNKPRKGDQNNGQFFLFCLSSFGWYSYAHFSVTKTWNYKKKIMVRFIFFFIQLSTDIKQWGLSKYTQYNHLASTAAVMHGTHSDSHI